MTEHMIDNIPLSSSVHENRMVRFAPFAAILAAFCLLCIFRVFHSPPDEGERLARLIMSNAMLSFRYEPIVSDICNSYVQYTDYEWRVLINKPVRLGHINVYVFKYDDRLPANLRYNCTAFPSSRIVLCDHDLLASIPVLPNLVADQDEASSFHPFLMYWIIGHELGHVLLNHGSSPYLPGHDPQATVALEQGRQKAREFVTQHYTGSTYELEADEFALKVLPIAGGVKNAALQFGWQLSDLIYDEVNALGEADNTLWIDPRRHPPMLLRMLFLTYQLPKIFPDFPTSTFSDAHASAGAIEVCFGPSKPPRVFFNGFYVASHPDAERSLRLVDRAIALAERGEKAASLALLRALGSTQIDDRVYEQLRHLVINSDTGVADRAVLESAVKTLATEGMEGDKERRGPCLGGVLLAGCAMHGTSVELGLPVIPAVLTKEFFVNWYQNTVSSSTSYTTTYWDADWIAMAEYLFVRDVLCPGEDKLDAFVQMAAENLLESHTGLAREIVFGHRAYVERIAGTEGKERLMEVETLCLELSREVKDYPEIIACGKRMLALSGAAPSNDSRLAVIHSRIGTALLQVTQSNPDFMDRVSKSKQDVAGSILEARKHLWTAFVYLRASRVPSDKAKDPQLLNETAEALNYYMRSITLLRTWRADLEAEPSLPALAEELLKESHLNWAVKVKMMNNLAAVSFSGKSQALEQANRWSVNAVVLLEKNAPSAAAGRQRPTGVNELSIYTHLTRMLAAFAAQNPKETGAAMGRLKQLYRQVNGRDLNPMAGSMVGGRFVSFGEIEKWAGR